MTIAPHWGLPYSTISCGGLVGTNSYKKLQNVISRYYLNRDKIHQIQAEGHELSDEKGRKLELAMGFYSQIQIHRKRKLNLQNVQRELES